MRLATTATLLCLFAAPLLAQDAQKSDPPPPAFYETTTVTARPVDTASSGVTLVPAASIEAGEARSAAEAIGEGPGLNLQGTGSRAGVTNAFLRGGDPNFTLVLLDGIALNDLTELQGGAVNLEELSTGLVERAEIVRGTSSSFYGSSSLAGAIQLLTPRGGPGPVRASLRAEAGSDSIRRGSARVSGPGAWALGGSWAEEAQRVGDDRFEQFDLWGTGDRRLGAATDLGMTLRYANGEQDDYPDSSGGPVYGSGELRHTEHEDVLAGVRLTAGAAARRHDVSVGLVHRSLDRNSPAVFPSVPASTNDTGFTRARLAWQVPLLTRGRNHVEAGASVEGEWGRSDSVLDLGPGGELPGAFDESRVNGGAYAGWRHERDRISFEASLRGDLSSDADAQLNPRAGVVWRSGATRIYASGGRASKVPSFYALGSPRALGGNPNLVPESALGGEVGADRTFASAHLTLGVAAFGQWFDDLIDFDFDTLQLVNRSSVRTAGVEGHVAWKPHPRVGLDGELTWLRAEDSEDAALLHEPELFGGLRFTWTPTERISLRLFARAVSKYEDRQIPVPDRTSVDGHTVAGLAGSWRFWDGLCVRARVDNVTGADYETFIGFPGPRRSAWVGLGWERR